MHSSLPKVLHPLAGRALLARVLDASNALNPEAIHIVVGHAKQQIITALAEHPARSVVNFVEQSEQLGTGHAMQTALPSIPNNAHVLMLTGDVPLINSKTLATLADQLTAHSLAILTANVADPFGLGRIIRSADDSVQAIIEEKDASPAQRNITEINSGIMAARANRLTEWLSALSNNNAQGEYYLTDIVGLAVDNGDPIATIEPTHLNEVAGINTRVQLATLERAAQLQTAEEIMLNGVTLADPSRLDVRGEVSIGPDTFIDVNAVLKGQVTIGRGVTIGAHCVIQDAVIGDGAIIEDHTVINGAFLAENTHVGPFARLRPGTRLETDVRLGNFVETKNAHFMAGAKANHLSYVGDSEVGQDTNIGAGVITCNYDGANKHKTTIGARVFVGSDSQLVAPVNIADDATIGAGSTITTDVGPKALAISRAKQRSINGWKRPHKK